MKTHNELEKDKKLDEIRPAFESWRKILKSDVSASDKKKATEEMVNLIRGLEVHDQNN